VEEKEEEEEKKEEEEESNLRETIDRHTSRPKLN
jgi:hypothetical protein